MAATTVPSAAKGPRASRRPGRPSPGAIVSGAVRRPVVQPAPAGVGAPPPPPPASGAVSGSTPGGSQPAHIIPRLLRIGLKVLRVMHLEFKAATWAIIKMLSWVLLEVFVLAWLQSQHGLLSPWVAYTSLAFTAVTMIAMLVWAGPKFMWGAVVSAVINDDDKEQLVYEEDDTEVWESKNLGEKTIHILKYICLVTWLTQYVIGLTFYTMPLAAGGMFAMVLQAYLAWLDARFLFGELNRRIWKQVAGFLLKFVIPALLILAVLEHSWVRWHEIRKVQVQTIVTTKNGDSVATTTKLMTGKDQLLQALGWDSKASATPAAPQPGFTPVRKPVGYDVADSAFIDLAVTDGWKDAIKWDHDDKVIVVPNLGQTYRYVSDFDLHPDSVVKAVVNACGASFVPAEIPNPEIKSQYLSQVYPAGGLLIKGSSNEVHGFFCAPNRYADTTINKGGNGTVQLAINSHQFHSGRYGSLPVKVVLLKARYQ